jgi:hypothetical protein
MVMHEIQVTPRLNVKLQQNEKALRDLGITFSTANRYEKRGGFETLAIILAVQQLTGFQLKDILPKLRELFTDEEITTLNLK